MCELGTVCSTTCKLRGPSGLFTCNRDDECAYGYCSPDTKLCNVTGYCHYSWADKLN